MTPGATSIPPPIVWAQRNDKLFVTIEMECKDPEYKFTADALDFKGTGFPENKLYEVSFNFFNKINPDNVTFKNTKRNIEFTIPKDKSGPYWPRLTEAKKLHFIKVDFNKWEDEKQVGSNSDEECTPEFKNIMNNLIMHDKKEPEGFDDLESDSDSDACPGLLDY